jgi:hypothetical protein
MFLLAQMNAFLAVVVHADHYAGIDEKWCHGPIFCSSVTACLVQHMLGVSREVHTPSTNLNNEKPAALSIATACAACILFPFRNLKS